MELDKALDLAYSLRRQWNTLHCDEPTCRVCATMSLATAVQTLRTEKQNLMRENHRLANALERAEGKPKRCPACKQQLVDGICGNCGQ